jgi:parallel beta-helix repeat protein
VSGNRIEGNFIGTDPSGTQDLGNDDNGVSLSSIFNTIGGTSPAARNLISGNTDSGVSLGGSSNGVLGNLIGTTKDGKAALGNGAHGVQLFDQSSFVEGNTIAFNGSDGVAVFLAAATGNRIRDNSIYNNGGQGIDLRLSLASTDAGPTPNDDKDPDAGPNNLQNFPEITSAKPVTSTVTKKKKKGKKKKKRRITVVVATEATGNLNSRPGQSYTLEFFSNPAADPSGFGEGTTFMAQTTVTTDANGNAPFSIRLAPTSGAITATATGGSTGDTSEFSAAKAVE